MTPLKHHKQQPKRPKFENIDGQECEHNSKDNEDNTNEGDPCTQRDRYQHISKDNGSGNH